MEQVSSTIYFGKYKGRSLNEIIAEDPRYVIWMFKQEWLTDKMRDLVEKSFGSLYVPFGKYNGHSMLYVKDTNFNYFQWLTKPDEAKVDTKN